MSDYLGEMELRLERGLEDDALARLRQAGPPTGDGGELAIPRDEVDDWLLRAGITPWEGDA